MTLLLDDVGRDDLIEAMDDLSKDLVPAVAELDADRVKKLLDPYDATVSGVTALKALAIAQAARIHVLTADGAR